MKKSIEKIFVDIIKHELNLPDNYGKTSLNDVIPSVIIYSQNIKLFNTDKLQVTVKTVSQRVYSNRSQFKENPKATGQNDLFIEIQDLNESRIMQIDCFSRNNDARERFWEIEMALNSTYAQQQMDKYNFKIGTIASANNISGIDGDADINRFSITFNVISHQHKETFINYYDKFSAEYYNEAGKFAEVYNPENQ